MSDKVKTLRDFENDISNGRMSFHWSSEELSVIERYATYAREQGFDQGVDAMMSQVKENARTKLVCWDSTCTGCGDSIDDCCLPMRVVDQDQITQLAQAAKESFKPY